LPPFYQFTGLLGENSGPIVYIKWPYVIALALNWGCGRIQSWEYNGPSDGGYNGTNGSSTIYPTRNCAPGSANCYYARFPDDEPQCAAANAAFCSVKWLDKYTCNYEGTQSSRQSICSCASYDPNVNCKGHGCYYAHPYGTSMWCGGDPDDPPNRNTGWVSGRDPVSSLTICVAKPYTTNYNLAGGSGLPPDAPPFDPYAAKQRGMQILGPGAQLNASFISRELARQAERASRRLSRGG
jgi:hypothetical protein